MVVKMYNYMAEKYGNTTKESDITECYIMQIWINR